MKRREVKKIKILVLVLNIVGGILALYSSVVEYFNAQKAQVYFLAYEILLASSLAFVVCHMRQTIKKTKIAFPNEKLVSVHLTNFLVWVPLYAY